MGVDWELSNMYLYTKLITKSTNDYCPSVLTASFEYGIEYIKKFKSDERLNNADNDMNHNAKRQQGEPKIQAWDVTQTRELPLLYQSPEDDEFNAPVVEIFNHTIN